MDRDPHFLGTYPDETEIGRFNRLCRARYAEHFATPGWPKGWYCENGSWFWWEHSMYHCKWQGEWYVWVVGQDEWILSENKDDPMDVDGTQRGLTADGGSGEEVETVEMKIGTHKEKIQRE